MSMPNETMTVIVRDRARDDALWGYSSAPWSPSLKTVTISAFCPTCGKRRGEVRGQNAYEDGVSFHVNVWTNPCGHTDMYPDVIDEAARLEAAQAGPAAA